ncbi:MAG: hypothetical protein GX660_02325, partial [Clostridiaceae bacterium]|nr:hypothetical protein [Clostridiaceae bacterium]
GEAKSKIEVAAPVEDSVTLNNELAKCQDSIAKVETTLSHLIDIPDDITEYVSTRLEFINGIKKVEQNRLAAKDWLDGVKLLISDWRARARFPAGLGAVAAVITTDCATAALDYHHVYQSLTRIRQLKASLLGSNPLLDFCPTCGQAWPEAKKEEFKLKLANYTEEEKQYETECNAKREYKELVDVYTEAHNEVMKARAHLKSQILFYKKKKSTLKFDMSTSVEDQTAAVEKAEAEIFAMRDAFSLKTKAKEQLLVLKNQEKYIFESLNKFKAYEKKYYKSKEIGTKLDSLRDIFHYDNLPKQIAFAYLDKIQSRVNEVLTLFNAPFRAMPDENMGFICKFADGSLFTDKRLSGGQKVVLGLAVRMAVNALFVGHLGMMILDEPSEGLDEHNLGCLPYALEKLADICKSNDMQVLFVTHMDRLSYLFDNIVNIGEETKL